MIRNKIIPLAILIASCLNRAFTKILEYGGVLESLLTLCVLIKPKTFISNIKNNTPNLIFTTYATIILVYEILFYQYDYLTIRRYAIGTYTIIPIIILSYKNEIKSFIRRYSKVIAAIFFIISFINFEDFQPTMGAQLAAGLFFVSLLYTKNFFNALLFLLIFIILSSGIIEMQSIYRTPIITFIIAYFTYISSNYFHKKNYKFISISFFTFVIIFIIISSGIFKEHITSIIIGIGGLLDNNSLIDIGNKLGGNFYTTRGDAAGTANTRLIFWRSIFEYQFTHISSLIFGYGYQHNFLEVTLPSMQFFDKELIEPHNSLINIFFRFGIIGLILFNWTIFNNIKHIIASQNLTTALPFIVISLLFISAEVALENPHGSLIFWLILNFPIIFGKKKKKNI